MIRKYSYYIVFGLARKFFHVFAILSEKSPPANEI